MSTGHVEYLSASDLPKGVVDNLCTEAPSAVMVYVNPKYHPAFKAFLVSRGLAVKPYKVIFDTEPYHF